MTIVRGERVTRHDRVEPVALRLREEPPRQAHGAQRLRLECEPGAQERVLEEAMVEARVVRHEYAVAQAIVDLAGERREGGAPRTIASVMPVSAWIAGGNGHLRVDQRAPLGDARRPARGAGIHPHDADLGDAVVRRHACPWSRGRRWPAKGRKAPWMPRGRDSGCNRIRPEAGNASQAP